MPAIISESGQELSYQPCNLDTIVYMHFCPKAFGTFLSHYRLWKHIVKNKISRSIILEELTTKSASSILSSGSLKGPAGIKKLFPVHCF